MTLAIKHILSETIDLEELLVKRPDLFNLSKLLAHQKIELLKENPKLFADKINILEMSGEDKVYALVHINFKKLKQHVKFTEEELKNLSVLSYIDLLGYDFDKYIRKDIYQKLRRSHRTDIFISHPEWVIANADSVPRLTSTNLRDISYINPNFVDNYITDFSQISVCNVFWENMIEYNENYKSIFIKNTKACITKTHVRTVIYKFPEIIKMIDADILANSKLTCKEWILLINDMYSSYEEEFIDWCFSEEVNNIFRLDLMAEMLNGRSKLSRRFQSAMNHVFKSKEETNEDTPVV